MSLTNAGRDEITKCLIGMGTVFNSGNAHLCIGDGVDGFDVGQTDLMATVNKFRQVMDPTYPQILDNTITYRATYGDAEANYEWNEWGVANDALAGVLLNRVVEYNGTKLSGQTWVFEVTLTISIGA